MTITLHGKELKYWDPAPFIISWIIKNQRFATDTRVCHKKETNFNNNQISVGKLL